MRESQSLLGASLDALADHVAILDEHGVILRVNEAWRQFADENQFSGVGYGVGKTYLHDGDRTAGPEGDDTSVAAGIREVLAGWQNRFESEYACHSPTERRWFLVRAVRVAGAGPIRIVVAHDNITTRKRAEGLLGAQKRVLEMLATGAALGDVPASASRARRATRARTAWPAATNTPSPPSPTRVAR